MILALERLPAANAERRRFSRSRAGRAPTAMILALERPLAANGNRLFVFTYPLS
jgi:hypothetical protein